MYKRTILFTVLIISALSVCADDSIKVSSGDLKALMQRIERLEQAEQNRPLVLFTYFGVSYLLGGLHSYA